MNRLSAVFCVLCAAFFAAAPFAEGDDNNRYRIVSIDAGAITATSPSDIWESTAGLSLGLVYRLSDNAGIRVSIERYKFPGVDAATTYTRIPVFLGGRFYFWNLGDLWSHGDLGMELSADQIQNASGGATNQNNMGGAALYGMLYEITQNLFMGADVKWHLNKNSFWSYGIHLGMVF